jgi:DNA-binding HxlR family transcriptional regulator
VTEDVVARTVFPTVPPGVEYTLTQQGHELLAPLTRLADWAVRRPAG